ncbi:DUF5801 repeats-in-toxin domain-containing protein [Billgrantia montanilacus]|uniref:DUF5801 repeats-in-toxin domain-containing protein n=1 Tax=Billgrantia montanilacus TaxID=2282305 RepID=UPI001C6A07FA|nr:DUF5801 repeats-in-toxin domain-containing protein [Halomonas montanilacus]
MTAELLSALPHNVDTDDLTISGLSVVASDQDGDSTEAGITVEVADDLPNVEGTEPSGHEVTITNLGSAIGVGYNNSFGYYIKDENGNPTAGKVIWSNVKDDVGVTYTLEGYAPGEVGYFIIPNGANLNSGLENETDITFVQVNGVWVAVTEDGEVLVGQDTNAPVLFSDSSLHPDGASHVENNAEEGDLNWEDIYGTGSDRDYNDVNINVEWTPANLTVDESNLDVTAAFDFSGYFSAEYGADGLDVRDYSLSVAEDGIDSGLIDTLTGQAVLVKEVDGEIVGYVVINSEEVPVFTLNVDAETGIVTLDQIRALAHPLENVVGASDPVNILAGVVFLTKSVKDGDGDEASAVIDIGEVIYFLDDGPSAFTPDNASLVEGFTGNINFADVAGSDGVGNVTFLVTEGSPVLDKGGNQLFLNGEPLFYSYEVGNESVLLAKTDEDDLGFKITLNPAADTYTISDVGEIYTIQELSFDLVGFNGGNSSLYDLSSSAEGASQGVLISTTSGETLNTSSSPNRGLGVSSSQGISDGEVARFNFVDDLTLSGSDASWARNISATQFEQKISYANQGGSSKVNFTIQAFKDVTTLFDGGEGDLIDTGNLVVLTADDITIYDGNNNVVVHGTNGLTVSASADGTITVKGMGDGWRFEVNSSEAFQAIEVEGASETKPFTLNDFSYGAIDHAVGNGLELELEGVDGDGDSANGTIDVETPEPSLLLVGNNLDNDLTGEGGADILIGDLGGKQTVIEPGQSYNISLILDASLSMNDPSGTPGLSRFQLAKQALKALADQLADHDGTVNIQLVAFSNNAWEVATVEGLNSANVDVFKSDIDSVSQQTWTNYEDAFLESKDWFDGIGSSGFENVTYFLTDGVPTAYNHGSGYRTTGGYGTNQTAMQKAMNAFEELADISTVNAIGIGADINEDYLRFFDNSDVVGTASQFVFGGSVTGPVGQVDIVNTAEDLDAALQGGSQRDELAALGDDILTGGDGDDILFGDTVSSDHLSWVNGDTGEAFNAGEHDGLGFNGLIEFLRWDSDIGNNGATPSENQIMGYIRENWSQLIDTTREDGGNNTLDGGAGDDILIGGAGDDILIGGAGDDILIGGAGDDILIGGLGADTFVWNLGDEGEEGEAAIDTVKDFSLEEGDSLDLSDLLSDGNGPEHLRFEAEEGGSTTLYISTEGNFGSNEDSFNSDLADQVIVLENFNGDLDALKANLNID